MNIHEHQAKEILKKFGIPVLNGVVIFNTKDIEKKIKKLRTNNFMLKAQIHAGGRGKAGGIKMVKNLGELKQESEKMFKKVLITPQTRCRQRLTTRSCLFKQTRQDTSCTSR
jgi:succinyl-CoA synthetase beta subunit